MNGDWAAAAPQVAAILATICTAICATISLWIRTKAAGMDKRLMDCEKMCKDCESHRKADQEKFQGVINELNEILDVEWPSDDFASKDASEKIMAAVKISGVNMRHASKIIKRIKERRNHDRSR